MISGNCLKICEGDPMGYESIVKNEKPLEALESFSQEFLRDRLAEFKLVEGYDKSKNYSEIKSMAHKWKGFCEPYGFIELGKLSAELENELKSNNVQKTTHLINEIRDYLNAKKAYILK